MNQKETLSIIIITFNSEKQIEKCINSLLGSYNKELIFRIIIVDNNSSDRTLDLINRRYKSELKNNVINIIKNSENVGFAKAVNKGIKISYSDYFLLINPDVFVDKDTIANSILFLKQNNYGVVGVKMIGVKGIQNGSYFRMPNLAIGIFEFTNIGKLLKYNYWHDYFYYTNTDMGNKEVDVVTGGYMIISNKVIKKIGLFDENFFMYLEDVDFCLRAKENGVKIGLCNTTVTHIGGASSKNRYKTNHAAWFRSRQKYYLKNFGLFANLLVQPLFLVDELFIKIRLLMKSLDKIISDAFKD